MDRLIYSSTAVEYIRFNNQNIQNTIVNKNKIPMRKLQKNGASCLIQEKRDHQKE
ncbi:hypothetical protein [Alkaliphilus peptidifermentans]|uniref:Uncharacterized protein n=1 Tax=Alkaliphilus peptidifermentans DSM 18978 TaxID=1120976 RepID=A0A1G5G256_9FIRM|nr:hypothetical protein [Alkaliphilus peptidifermentans]SCY45250.1 hypothetical protein SAMN03080606_01569 [Alkaliphilus peptidifermentans DSM 18978]